jgi:hypothetical protein
MNFTYVMVGWGDQLTTPGFLEVLSPMTSRYHNLHFTLPMLVTPFQEEFLYHTKAFDTTCAKMYRQEKGELACFSFDQEKKSDFFYIQA